MIKSSEFVSKARWIAEDLRTLYVMGSFGAPLNDVNKQRYIKNHDYNKAEARKKKILAASADTFGFDCVCLIKSILWNFAGDKTKTYGGAAYASNGVPDIDADQMIRHCSPSADFSQILPGEMLWKPGHAGIYIGDGLAVECTPIWKDGVQITGVSNIGKKPGYNMRSWDKHGRLPWVDYSDPTPAYQDLDPKAWYYKYMVWAIEKGLITGYGDGTYRPNDPVTRAQLATILYRIMEENK